MRGARTEKRESREGVTILVRSIISRFLFGGEGERGQSKEARRKAVQELILQILCGKRGTKGVASLVRIKFSRFQREKGRLRSLTRNI